jgi:branched-chain amino acid transport system ATP-binding protein
MLNVEDIHTYYGDSYVLQGVSLKVEDGQVIGMLGRNGMGKTTFIRSIMRYTPPRQGRVSYQNTLLNALKPFQIARLGISVVPQGRQIFPSLNVRENLLVGARNKANGWTMDRVFDLFPRLKERSFHPGNKLSGGEQQMLAIARSLMTNPSLLLMDEPTEGLSPLFVTLVGEVIENLKKSGISILLVEQNLRFALGSTDYIHILSRGQIVYSSLPKDLEGETEIRIKYLGV